MARMRSIKFVLAAVVVGLVSAGCLASAASGLASDANSVSGTAPVTAPRAKASATPQPTPLPLAVDLAKKATATAGPANWQDYSVVPSLSDRAIEIYQQGLLKGNDPHRFSKIGDCQNITTYFLSAFEDPDLYTLGEDYAGLQETIDWYFGSFARESLAVAGGLNVARVLSPFHANRELCGANENSLDCEVRVHNPSVAIVSMEENWSQRSPEEYEKHLRTIVESLIDKGVLPILATKADNLEGDHSINATIAKVAADYEIPLWNFWLAVQPLPTQGLHADGFHLTVAGSHFDDAQRMKKAWPWRNLTALQSLDSVLEAVKGE